MHFSFIFILLIGLINGEIQHVCEVCFCDNRNKPTTVHCDSKQLSTLTNIDFNSTIKTLSFINNSLSFKSVDDLTKINGMTSLKTLIITNNPLMIIPELSLPNLIDLQLENTHLKSAIFPKSYANCTNLQSISLASNSLDSAEFLSIIPNLHSIDFDHNKFKQLPNEIAQPGRTKYFSFRHNRISVIDEDSPLFSWMKNNLTDIEIYLENNPFDCCRSRWFIHHLSDFNNLVKDALNLTCVLPKRYSGRRLIDLHTEFMDCSSGLIQSSNKLVLFLLCLSGVIVFIVIVVTTTLYQRIKVPVRRQRRRREYRSLQIDDIFT